MTLAAIYARILLTMGCLLALRHVGLGRVYLGAVGTWRLLLETCAGLGDRRSVQARPSGDDRKAERPGTRRTKLPPRHRGPARAERGSERGHDDRRLRLARRSCLLG
jgi:hypothetical protein